MTRLEELTWNLADDLLTETEASELEALLARGETAQEAHIRILQIEAGLRASRQNRYLAPPIIARLHGQVAESIAQDVMSHIRALPIPERLPGQGSEEADMQAPPGSGRGLRSSRRKEPLVASGQRVRSLLKSAATFRNMKPAWLALAACLVLGTGVGFWCFGPTVGEPVLAEIRGSGLSLERAGQPLPAQAGMRLQPGDVLRTPDHVTAAITFGSEKTRITVQPRTEVKLLSIARGKQFSLAVGKLEATVARQRPFSPMLITTPHAEARVLGTRFTLRVATNATRLEVAEGKVRFARASDSANVAVAAGQYAVAAANYELLAQPLTGSILREFWTNLPGPVDRYADLFSLQPELANHPSGHDFLDKFEATGHWGRDYAARARGYLHPPRTGDYTFWIAAGDGAKLFLSPDDNPNNKKQLAFAATTASQEGLVYQRLESPSIALIAGRKYYIEAQQGQSAQKEDHLSVAWQGPGREREVIPGEFLSAFIPKPKEHKP